MIKLNELFQDLVSKQSISSVVEAEVVEAEVVEPEVVEPEVVEAEVVEPEVVEAEVVEPEVVEPEEIKQEDIVICEPEVEEEVQEVDEHKPPQLSKQVSIAIKGDQEDSEDDIELTRVGQYYIIKGTRVVMNMDDGNAIGYLDSDNHLVRVNNDEVKRASLLHRISFSS